MFGWMIAGAGQNPPSGMTSPPGPDAPASLSVSVTAPLRPGSDPLPPAHVTAYGNSCDSQSHEGPGGLGSDAETAADDLLHDLGGAAEDGLRPAVGVGPGHRVLPHVAVAAVQLDAPVDDPVAQLGVPPLEHGGFLGAQPAGVVLGDAAVGERAGHRQLGRHLG